MPSVLFPVFVILSITTSSLAAADVPVPVTVFVRSECAHCRELKAFLDGTSGVIVDVRDLDDERNRAQFEQLARAADVPLSTPLTFVSGTVISGFDVAETTGQVLKQALVRSRGSTHVSLDDYLQNPSSHNAIYRTTGCDETGGMPCEDAPILVRIPFTSETFDARGYSLPILAAVLGFIDGFNPCAMWVLVTFLIVLLQLGNPWRMAQVAGLFIIAETVMYYAILNVWFTTWDFIGLDSIVTPLVGLLAAGSGAYFLYEGMTSDGTCKVASPTSRRRAHQRIQSLASAPLTMLTAAGIVGMAFSVNVIEFACSIGIPQTFTKLLDLNAVNVLERQGLMATYILGYMTDDFLVFGLALWGANYVGLTHRYARLSHLVGGAIMVGLGTTLLIAPEWLRAP